MTATLLIQGRTTTLGPNERSRTDEWYSTERNEGLAIIDVGILVGSSPPDDGSLAATSVSASPNPNGAGSIVRVTYSSNPPSASSFRPYDPITNPASYSWSVSSETVVVDVPIVRTILNFSSGLDGSGNPVRVSTWTEPEVRQVETVRTRITYNGSATAEDLNFSNAGSLSDLNIISGAQAAVNRIMQINGTDYLFRSVRISQRTEGQGGLAQSNARFDISYEWVFDPGVVGINTGLVNVADKDALASWTKGDGTQPDAQGYLIPNVESPYANGPSGRFQIPPYSYVEAVPSVDDDPENAVDVAPRFVARGIYDTTSLTLNQLPGVV